MTKSIAMVMMMRETHVLRYVLYPLRLESLMLVLTFGSILVFAISDALIDIRHGVFGIPIVVVIGSWFFKYAFVLLNHLVEGRPNLPVLSPEMANPFGEMRPVGYLIAISIFYAVTVVVGRHIGPITASIMRLIGLCALPAVIATQAVTGSFIEAINPRLVGAMIWRMGSDYLWVLVVSVACWAAGWIVVTNGSHWILFIRLELLMFIWLAQFSLLGGVIYERRNELGYEPEHSPERHQARDDAERDRLRNQFIARIFGEYRSGAFVNAWNSIQQHAQESKTPLDEYRWIYERITPWPNSRLANRLLQEMLPSLLAAQHNGEAIKLVKARMQADAEFRPQTPDQLIRLIHLARDGGDRPLARALLQDFDRLFPNSSVRDTVIKLSASFVDR